MNRINLIHMHKEKAWDTQAASNRATELIPTALQIQLTGRQGEP